LLAALLLAPVDLAAQQRSVGAAKSGDRRSDARSSNDRGSADGKSGDRGSADRGERADRGGRTADHGDRGSVDRGSKPHNTLGKSTLASPQTPWWEQQRTPWWEKPQTPWWEQPNAAARLAANPVGSNVRGQHVNGRRDFKRHTGPGVIYVVSPYRYFPYSYPGTTESYVTPPAPTEVISPGQPQQQPAPVGFLRLEVEPRDSIQIFVDGVYIGTAADVGDDIPMVAGVRRIEIRARGFKPLIFDAEILDQRSITYRGSLDRDEAVRPEPPPAAVTVAPPAPPGSTTMYMIAGCYLGNVPPKASELRAGCDISKLTTSRP
jgi:hypothetical protein